LHLGFVYPVVGDADLMPAAHALADRLAALPPWAFRQTRHLMRRVQPNLPGKIIEEPELSRKRVRSPEAAEAFATFTEKRAPDFSRFS
jgi:enoyl-CoA hydratase/carnithine racemase